MKVYGLIGYPLTHSFSKKFFTEKFEKENIIDINYLNLPINSIHLFPGILKSIENIAGFNITSPYKEQIIPYLDEIDKDAKQIGAVNVIKIIKKGNSFKLKGYNTDVFGFTQSLKKYINPKIKNALILGTGGAAKAVAHGLKSIDIKYKFVTSKQNKNQTIGYSNLNTEVINKNLLIINATPIGIFPDINEKPNIPYKFISDSHILFDLIYNPSETLFLKEGKKKGAKIINGHEMLELQAEKAWNIFNS